MTEPSFEERPEDEERGSLRRTVQLAAPLFRAQRFHFLGAFLLLVLSSALVVAGPLLIRRAIDRDIAAGDWSGLQETVALYLGAMLLHMAVFYVMRVWLEWAGQRMMADLKRRLFSHVLALPLAFHDRHAPGKLMSRVENDTEALRQLFTTTAVMLLGDLLLFVGMFAAMYTVEPKLAAVVSFVLPVLFGSGWWVHHVCRPYFLRVRRLTADLCGRLAEYVQGAAVLQAFHRTRWATGAFQELNRARFSAEYAGDVRYMGWFNGLILMETASFALILGVGGVWALQGAVTIGTLAMFMGYVRRFFEPLLRLGEQMLIVQKGSAAAERISELFALENPLADPAEPAAWPGLDDGIRFENVWFRYGEGDWVLRDVSFHLPAGETWAVVGPTGAGKTTLLSLLLRFYDPQKGRVLVGGVDLRHLPAGELRRRVGLVLQDLYLFPGNLRANLTLGREVSAGGLDAAVAATHAGPVVSRLSGGLDAELAERGGNLSFGERQLLAFTPAVAHDPELLLLDEATSAIDPATEARIQRGLGAILSGRTALVIAHRLSTVRSADRILVVRDGAVAEAGTHDELMERGGLYRDLSLLQNEEDDHAPAR